MLNIFCNFEIDFHILKGTNVLYINLLLSKLGNTTYNLSAEEDTYSFFIHLLNCTTLFLGDFLMLWNFDTFQSCFKSANLRIRVLFIYQSNLLKSNF